MITDNGVLQIQEQADGVYVFPNSKTCMPTWAIYAYNDGRVEFYRKRNPKTGALLGKPESLSVVLYTLPDIPAKTVFNSKETLL